MAGGTPESERLRAYIWERLAESLLRSGRAFIGWIAMLHLVPTWWPFNGGAPRLKEWSRDEFNRIKDKINHQEPWPIRLIGKTRKPTENHQVLAYGYEDHGNDTGVIYIYDNNAPDEECELTVDFRGNVLQASHSHYTRERGFDPPGFQPEQGPIQGFFCIDHQDDTSPPVAIGLSQGMWCSAGGPVQLTNYLKTLLVGYHLDAT